MWAEFFQICGWIGSVAYAIFAVPQTIHVVRRGNAKGLDPLFIGLVFFGAVFSSFYAIENKSYPLLFNFGLNIVVSMVLLKYRYFPIKRKKKYVR